MRVDLLTREYPPEVYGGAGVHVAELVKVLRGQISVKVRAFGAERVEQDTASYQFSKSLASANPALQSLGVNLEMASDCAGSDLVHSHTWYANYAGLLASKLYAIPHVITAHSLEPLRPWKREQLAGGYELSSYLERSAYQQAELIIAVSDAMRNDILRVYPELNPKWVRTIHNGIDLEQFRATDDKNLLTQLGINPNLASVLFVGRITRQKGLRYLLKAAMDLPENVQLVLAAGAPDTPEILNEITDLVDQLRAVREGVVWISDQLSRNQLVALLSHARVFACPSIYEPLGIVNLEAMACGTAVVATATGGIPEVVEDGKTGILVEIEQSPEGGEPVDEDGFVKGFAAALNAALDGKTAESFGAAGRARVENLFSWERIAEQTISAYRAVLG